MDAYGIWWNTAHIVHTLFSVTAEQIKALGPRPAIDLLSKILWAEATRLGIEKTSIVIPTQIHDPDGGIDAEVKLKKVPAGGQGLLLPGRTCYQIKTGEFNLGEKKHVRDILYNKKGTKLKERIGSCLDRGDTLVVVLFGWDGAEMKDNQLKKKFIDQLDAKYKKADIRFIRPHQLAGSLMVFPSLALEVKGSVAGFFKTHHGWSDQEDMRRGYEEGQEQIDLIKQLSDALRAAKTGVHIRVLGEPGIGKTRLVLEATRQEDLLPLVLYTKASDFRDRGLLNELLKDDNTYSVIAVIDECNSDEAASFWNQLRRLGSRLRLVTIHSEFEKTTGDTKLIEPPLLQDEQIGKIIESYNLPKDVAEKWVEACSGSPRVAHVIGMNLQGQTGDILQEPDTEKIWDRYMVGGDDPKSQKVQERELVLRYISLFKKFGMEPPLDMEAKAIAALVQEHNPQITLKRFEEIVRELRDRKILQGDFTLYITPKALHIKLWRDWWKNHGTGFKWTEFEGKLTGNLPGWFKEMFRYGTESEAASSVIDDLLGPRGSFADIDFLDNESNSGFFHALTVASPSLALRRLEDTIGKASKDRLTKFKTGRRNVIWSLEEIVQWDELFVGAARLMLSLAEAENENWSNNATGLFAGLFTVATGKFAPTEAVPEKRLPILKEALTSKSKARRMAALEAVDQALESQHFSRVSGVGGRSFRREPKLWEPKKWKEILDAYRGVWNLVIAELDNLETDEQQKAIKALIHHAPGLSAYQPMADMIMKDLNILSEKAYVDKEELLSQAIWFLRYRAKDKDINAGLRKEWQKLKKKLEGSGFSAELNRAVRMDLLDDHIDEKGEITDTKEKKIASLAEEVMRDPSLLTSELPWLVSAGAKSGWSFGYELGKRDTRNELLPVLLEAQRAIEKNPSAYFLGGYFRAIRERDQNIWERKLDALENDAKLKILIPELTWRSDHISDRAAERILRLALKGDITYDHFRILYLGNASYGLSEEHFAKWIQYLLGCNETGATEIALDLYYFYYHYRRNNEQDIERKMPKELTEKLLAHPTLGKSEDGQQHRKAVSERTWEEMAEAYVGLYPEKSLAMAKFILENFGEEGSIFAGFHSRSSDVLSKIAAQHPDEVWEMITGYIDLPRDSRAFHITEWLRGSHYFARDQEGGLALIPLGKIWEWVDKDLEKRPWYLATFVPKSLVKPADGGVSIARELLIRYGDREDVRRNLSANYGTEGWTGEASMHYTGKKESLLKMRKNETEPNVIRWLDEEIEKADWNIKNSKMREERDF